MLRHVDFIEEHDCTGCESCAAVCSISCIKMVQDNRGFYYPMVDTGRCVNCGVCARICPVINPIKKTEFNQEYYACRATNQSVVMNSSSGGVFTIIAEHILSKGGLICGASFDKDFTVVHKVVDSIESLRCLQGSKYVQSRTENAMRQLKKSLSKHIPILFVGTPCQVAGARRLLWRNQTDVYFVEVVCHGIPSPGVFHKYIKEIESENDSVLSTVNFRDKSNGWRAYKFSVLFQNGTTYSVDGCDNPYIKGFIDNLYLRSCCTACHFKNFKSGADLTIGDFWGIEMVDKNSYDEDLGVSAVAINTKAGAKLFDYVRGELNIISKVNLEELTRKNSCIVRSTTYNPQTKRFYRYLKNNSVAQSVELAGRVTFMDCIKNFFAYRLGQLFNAKS